MFDRSTAERILPPFIQDVCFMMVVSNSCMNPIIYGSFVMDLKKLSCQCTDCGEKTSTDSLIPSKFNVSRVRMIFFSIICFIMLSAKNSTSGGIGRLYRTRIKDWLSDCLLFVSYLTVRIRLFIKLSNIPVGVEKMY